MRQQFPGELMQRKSVMPVRPLAERAPGHAFHRLSALGFLTAVGLQLAGCADAPAAPAPTETAPAALHRVGEGRFAAGSTAAGTVRLRRETPLAFLSDGRVRSISVREGDLVRGGQLLATLDRTAIDAQVQSAATRLRQADAELRRQRQLSAQGWVSTARVESAEAAAEGARAELSGARFTQRFATIAAPTSGVILSRAAEPGQTLQAGTPVLVLGEFASGFVVRVPLPARRLAGLTRGQEAQVSFRDGAAPPMAGRILEIAGRADPGTGTFQVELALPAHPALRSGLIADVALPDTGTGARVAIPASALFGARADEGFVWVMDPATRKVRARLVQIGRVTPDGVELVSGLARGEQIVAAGVDRFTEGTVVKPVQTRAG
jgi:RND family efflux transporter MFP subunit